MRRIAALPGLLSLAVQRIRHFAPQIDYLNGGFSAESYGVGDFRFECIVGFIGWLGYDALCGPIDS